jgi:NitT/TauT family transport system ATP-binding protein
MMVFQEFDQLPPWKTVLENVMFPLLASRKATRAQARDTALHFLNKVGLADFADVMPHMLSGDEAACGDSPRAGDEAAYSTDG